MKQETIETPKKSREERLAESIRAKRLKGLTLTKEEEVFFREQTWSDHKDDNPYQS